MHEYTFTVLPEHSSKRLDVFLIERCSAEKAGISRTAIQKIIQEAGVSIDGVCIVKPHTKVKAGQNVSLRFEEKKPVAWEAENIPLEIVYQDNDLAVINKPCGLVVHPAPGNYDHTLVQALLYHLKQLSDVNPLRPGIVHRLDKDTSGLLVVAKNNQAHLLLSRQFAQHTITRKYIALVKGRMEFNEHIIEMAIGRHPFKRENMSVGVGKNVRYAKTYYRTLKRTDNASLLELSPYTGRTHQLRVHLAYINHPILGDTKYGKNNKFPRLALHAILIGFIHPSTGKQMEFSCATPEEFKDFINNA